MEATVNDFNYGAVTPVVAYLMACLGAALGLRCTTRSLRRGNESRKAGWLALGATAIGSGIWTMHFIAMIGFSIEDATLTYDTSRTLLSLLVAIVVVGIGVFIVGYRGATPVTLGVAGVTTGLGVAAMHYLGMSAIHVPGHLEYDAVTVALSVLIAVGAATAALWAAVSIHGLGASLGASLVMGLAVTGMHYTGMAAVGVHLDGTGGTSSSSTDLMMFLLAMLAGPVSVLVLAAVIVLFDPEMVLGDGEWNQPAAPASPHAPGAPAQRATHADPRVWP
ncbi:MHYT domain-containing protein [Streptomyces sp. NPDC091292]|uniref:MHYT domain-containing protein n=1 Tax=Streptomyces sp. NPDC091292 TaxID=3365991 RepID=UPI003814128A